MSLFYVKHFFNNFSWFFQQLINPFLGDSFAILSIKSVEII